MTHGATLGGFAVKAAVERAGIDAAEVDDVLMGCANPEGATGANIARQIALRAGLPITTSGVTVNRFCSSGLQTIAMAAQRIIAGEADIYVAGGVESISCVQQEMNTHMMADPLAAAAQARDLLEHAADRRAGGQALRHQPRAHGPLRRRQPAEGLPPRWRPGLFKDEIVPDHRDRRRGRRAAGPAQQGSDRQRRTKACAPAPPMKASATSARRCPAGVISAGNASQFSDGAGACVVMHEAVASARA
jgi:acetyl-CoA C-acetyltransferase